MKKENVVLLDIKNASLTTGNWYFDKVVGFD